jgi:hypothetical protein
MSEVREKYLAAALNVVKGVKSKVPFGASNRGADYDAAFDKFHKKIEGANPNALDKLLGKMTYFLPLLTGANRAQQIYNETTGEAPSNPLERFRQVANITVRTKAGNCNEQSIVAFMDLYDLGIRPLAWVHLDNGRHAFVVIGRSPKSGSNPSKWGENCVVCDPWANEAYYLPADSGAGILQTKWGCPTATPQFGVE